MSDPNNPHGTWLPQQRSESFRGAPQPGSYLAIAIPTVDGYAWMDPGVLESLRARATPLMLGEGDTKQLDLEVVSLGTQ